MAFLDAYPTLGYIITWIVLVACFGTLLSYARWRFNRMEEKQDIADARYHKCQAELPKTYANKKDVKELFGRTEKVEKKISYIRGVHNGKKEQQPQSV